MTGLSSFVGSYLDSCLAANLCTQFMDDFGCGAETYEKLIPSRRQNFNSFRKLGLGLTPQKCEFGMNSIKLLGKTTTPQAL